MDPITIGAALGVLQGLQQQQNEKAQRQVAAATIAYSPYTGANINSAQNGIHPANPSATIGQGLMAGAQMQQQQAMTDWLKNSSQPGAAFGVNTPAGNAPPALSDKAMAHLPPSSFGSAPWSPYNAQGPQGQPGRSPQSVQESSARPTQTYPLAGGQVLMQNTSPYASFPMAGSQPGGYRGPTRNADGSLGPYLGGSDNPSRYYDDYDAWKGGR